jgi:hypothetical protein
MVLIMAVIMEVITAIQRWSVIPMFIIITTVQEIHLIPLEIITGMVIITGLIMDQEPHAPQPELAEEPVEHVHLHNRQAELEEQAEQAEVHDLLLSRQVVAEILETVQEVRVHLRNRQVVEILETVPDLRAHQRSQPEAAVVHQGHPLNLLTVTGAVEAATIAVAAAQEEAEDTAVAEVQEVVVAIVAVVVPEVVAEEEAVGADDN